MKHLLVVLFLLTATMNGAAAQTSDCIWSDQETGRRDPGTEATISFHHGFGESPFPESGERCNQDVPPGPDQPLQVDVEVTGSNDPDRSNTPETPDLTCELPAESGSSCAVSYAGTGAGVDQLRAWIDADRNDATDERDDTEGRFEGSQPGEFAEPDGTEVASITWRFPECRDGIDNDDDGSIDHPADTDCDEPDDDFEDSYVCNCPRPPGCMNADNLIIGTNGSDILIGTDGKDCILGGGGDDVIRGRGGADLLFGFGDDDTLWGGAGSDLISGGGADDEGIGGRGADTLKGEEGADLMWGTRGNDTLRGGDGRDSLAGGQGRDSAFGGSGRDHCSAERMAGC